MGLVKDNTTSMLFTKIDKIINLLVSEMDKDQELKRYLTYLTYSPLEKRSVNYDNKIYFQKDLEGSLLEEQKIDISKKNDGSNIITIPQILFPYPYQSSKINEEYCTVFLYNHTYEVEEAIGENIYKIDIIIPSTYLELRPYGESRGHKIMQRIAELFDLAKTDKDSSKELGDLEFKLIDRAKESKIVNSVEATLIELQLATNIVNGRFDNRGYNSRLF